VRTRPLDVATLERLERCLQSVGAESLAGESPGVDAAELTRVERALRVPLPRELALWWTWRTWRPGLILPAAQFGPLPACLAEYASRVRSAGELQSEDSGQLWHALWFPVLAEDGGIVIAADLAAGDHDAAPLRRIDWQGFGSPGFAEVVADSLGEYVTDALDAIDAGRYVYDHRLRFWRLGV
jgi:cell wall assembly regulator SMI1